MANYYYSLSLNFLGIFGGIPLQSTTIWGFPNRWEQVAIICPDIMQGNCISPVAIALALHPTKRSVTVAAPGSREASERRFLSFFGAGGSKLRLCYVCL